SSVFSPASNRYRLVRPCFGGLPLRVVRRLSLQRALPTAAVPARMASLLEATDRYIYLLQLCHGWSHSVAAEGVIPDPSSSDCNIRRELLQYVLPLLEHYKQRQLLEAQKKRPVETLWKAAQNHWQEWLQGKPVIPVPIDWDADAGADDDAEPVPSEV